MRDDGKAREYRGVSHVPRSPVVGVSMRDYVNALGGGTIFVRTHPAERGGWIAPTATVTIVDPEWEEITLTLGHFEVGELRKLIARVERALGKMPDLPDGEE